MNFPEGGVRMARRNIPGTKRRRTLILLGQKCAYFSM